MKATLLAFVTLAAGLALGYFLTRREFDRDVLPLGIRATAAGSGSTTPAKLGPKVTMLSSERYEFGSMDRSEHKVHDFLVVNDGDEPLTLSTGEFARSVSRPVAAAACSGVVVRLRSASTGVASLRT